MGCQETEMWQNSLPMYHNLYTSAESEDGMAALQLKIKQLVQSEDSEGEGVKLTGEVVKKSVLKMKRHKMDISQGFSSDALLNAPDLLFQLLAMTFQD